MEQRSRANKPEETRTRVVYRPPSEDWVRHILDALHEEGIAVNFTSNFYLEKDTGGPTAPIATCGEIVVLERDYDRAREIIADFESYMIGIAESKPRANEDATHP